MSDIACEMTIRRGASVPATPRVSVVIPAYRAKWLDEALDSVRAQDFSPIEIVVVDDGSPEPVLPKRTDDLVLVRQPNAGPGNARNRGASLARGRYLAFLDADDRFLPHKIAHQLELHERRDRVVLSSTRVAVFRSGESPLPHHRFDYDSETIPFQELIYENCICCSSTMIRADAFRCTTGMSPHHRLGEDFVLWLQLGLRGEIGHVREVLVERRAHEDSLMTASFCDGSWRDTEFAIYQEFFTKHPWIASTPYARAALGRLEFQSGYDHLTRAAWPEARSAFLRSIIKQPMRLKSWINMVRSILHIGVVRS